MTRSQDPLRERRAHRLGRIHALIGRIDPRAPQRPHHQLGVIRRVLDYQEVQFGHERFGAASRFSFRTSQYKPNCRTASTN